MCLGGDDPAPQVAVNTVKQPVEAAPGALQPDPADPTGKQAQLAARMRLFALDGLRSTFTSGYRGEGGPSRGASNAQLDWRTAPAPAAPTYGAGEEPVGTASTPADTGTLPDTQPPFTVDPSAPGGKGRGPKPITQGWWQP